jgi:LmbE family N-acetylglucosaminyl deacetylase/2-polyprenyl-3-methyl-5-hydroxy-6-metoxy-1,4-benzoquinol methylase/glycosyltransferase involved in cell wall biosynthesis
LEKLLVPGIATLTLPGTRILVLAPHPDDEVFGCGGAILRHVAQGHPVHVIIWTDGAWGVNLEDRAACIAQRRAESEAAAQLLGYGQPEFRDHADRTLRYGEDLVLQIQAAIDVTGADLLYAPSVLEMHPDHRALALAAVEAVRRRGKAMRIALYEVGIPLRPNTLLDISDLAARKLEAMQCFTSQLARQRYDLDVAALNRFRSYTLPAAVTAAEAYVVVSGDELMRDPLGLHQSEHTRQRALGLPLDSSDYPLVSVIVRSLDRPSLALALDSVALQTYANIEVVLVNAGGAPHRDPGEWCGRFPLRLVEPGKPLDRAAAANCGLDAARGELLIFLDDDDLFLPHHIYRLQQELARHDHAIAAYAGVLCTDIDGRELHYYAEEFDLLKLNIGNYIPIHALLFRRAALAKGARFDETLPVCEDWDFWLQLQQFGMFKFVAETGAVYRMQVEAGSGVWSDMDRNRRVILQIYRRRMPHWSDDILWGMFEWTRFKSMYEELLALHNTEQQQLRMRIASDESRFYNERTELRAALKAKDHDYGAALAGKDAALANAAEMQEYLLAAVRERDQQLAALHASTSWRITRPLRSLMWRLRRARPQPPAPLDLLQQGLAPAPPQELRQDAPPPARNPYDYVINLDEPCAAGFVLDLLGKDRRVLEVGCGPGSMTKLLKEIAGSRVTGLELDAQAVEQARQWCEAIHRADLNAPDWSQVLGATAGFDSVIAADVLEHLYDPWAVLRQMATLLGPDGNVIVSLPHAGHAAIAGCLVNGDVRYSESGLLDRTHIRFFGLKNIEDLFAQADLKIIAVRHVIRAPEDTELAGSWKQLSAFERAALKLKKHSDIYQVVVKAVPVERPGAAVPLL